MELETQCPKCKNNFFKESADFQLDAEFTCAICRHASKLGNFLTADARNKIMNAAQQAAIKAFSDIPGFKKR